MHVKTQELVDGKNKLLEDNRKLNSKIDELQLKLEGQCVCKQSMIVN
jgi:hypothetical protein